MDGRVEDGVKLDLTLTVDQKRSKLKFFQELRISSIRCGGGNSKVFVYMQYLFPIPLKLTCSCRFREFVIITFTWIDRDDSSIF